MWKMAFSVIPSRAATIARTNANSPKKMWMGMYVTLIGPAICGYMKLTKPATHCTSQSKSKNFKLRNFPIFPRRNAILHFTWHPNTITADNPTHECNEYKFGIGGLAILCELNTAIRARMMRIIITPNSEAWDSFKFFFLAYRRPRYSVMAENIRKVWALWWIGECSVVLTISE